MIVRQSLLKTWQTCPEKLRLEMAGHPRQQSGALTFGTIIHACVEILETRSLDEAQDAFEHWWAEPTTLDPSLKIDYYLRGTNWKKYRANGKRILEEWAAIHSWNTDAVLAREFTFDVPIGDGHILHGTIDRLAVRNGPEGPTIVVSDYKTSRKEPTYDWLEDDLQFTSYLYATLRPEFWATFSDGEERFERYKNYRRFGEWIQLLGPKVKAAGTRSQAQYNRLIRMVNQLARSVDADIYVPTISGESCKWCDFRQSCGLEEVEGT